MSTRVVQTKVGFQTSVETMEEAMSFVMEKLAELEKDEALPFVEIKGHMCYGHDEEDEEPHRFFEVTVEGLGQYEAKAPVAPWET